MFRRFHGLQRMAAVVFAVVTLGALVVLASPGGAVTGSTFESSDGNLTVNTAGNKDWANAPSLVRQTDKASGTSDDAFGQGAKEDVPDPSVVSGSIPPNKSDLTQFYASHEVVSGSTFLYLAWERSNVLGNANMDFEFNQSKTLTSNGVTPARTAGDFLVTFDFTNGGGNPVLGLLTWVTSGSTAQCFSSNTLPCWGKRLDLSAAGFADGAVNTSPALDPYTNQVLPGLTFGEAGINLTASGVFPAGQCESFGTAYLKSRSSSSFTAEMKDFIAPAQVNVTNCGTINIHKQDDATPANALQGAVFTLYKNGTATSFTCTTDASGNCSMTNVPFGTYTVTETTTPPGYNTAASQPTTISGTTPTVSLNFTDPRKPGTVNIHKTDDAGTALQGAAFTLYLDNAPVGGTRGAEDVATLLTCTTNTSGNCTISNVPPVLSYWVVETTVPTGYDGAADQHITNMGLGATVSLSFVDQRKFTIIVVVCQQGTANTLHASNVTVDGQQKTSLGANGGGAVTDATVCSLGGANYPNKHAGAHPGSVNIN